MELDLETLVNAMEALIFTSGEPLSVNDLKKTLKRAYTDGSEEQAEALNNQFNKCLDNLKQRWEERGGGVVLLKVGDGFTFRSDPKFAEVLRAMRKQRPMRLSKPALETLAIVAYRQPATKPEIDFIRGVDCGGTLRLLLDREMVRIVGKKDEPGRPLLYGTTRHFLSFFNLQALSQLPSLREYHELTDASQEELSGFDSSMGLTELSEQARKFRVGDEPELDALDQAINELKDTEKGAGEALASQGMHLKEQAEPGAAANQNVQDAGDPSATPTPEADSKDPTRSSAPN